MNAPRCDGRIVLNVGGKRYFASFSLERGAMTVTFGSASSIVEVGDVEDPKSVARTVLRAMVTEGRAASALTGPIAIQQESTERIVARGQIFVRPRKSMRHARTRH